MSAPAPAMRDWMRRWVFKGQAGTAGTVTLAYRRIYILPTRQGLTFALMLLVLWLAAINYNNSLLFMLAFLLGGLATVGILHTFRNLVGLRVTPLPAEPVFAGQPAHFPLRLDNPGRRVRTGISAQHAGEAQGYAEVGAEGQARLALRVPTERRGPLKVDRFSLVTLFPLGLFRAWSWLDLKLSCLVYPAPEAGAVPPPTGGASPDQGRQSGLGDEDFQGLRRYTPGDSPGRVAWRVVARGQEPQSKLFAGEARSRVWLDWHALSGLDTEARLSRLCRWVLDADAAGKPYGLRLPTETIPPGLGAQHRHRCLAALALYPA